MPPVKNGRANARASSASASARRISSRMFCSRLRLVMRGGEGARNISELNACRPSGVRRIRWKMIGNAIATMPAMYNGASKPIGR